MTNLDAMHTPDDIADALETIIRCHQEKAWDEGYVAGLGPTASLSNPYRGDEAPR